MRKAGYAAPPLLSICLDLGERGWAKAVAEQAAVVVPDPGEPALLQVMILDDAGRPERVRAALEPVLRGAAACHVVTTAVHARVLAAEMEIRRDASARAHELIVEAVEVVAAEEVARPLLERPVVRELLTAARGRFGRCEPFVERVLAAGSPLATAAEREPVRLSPAELAVLRELPSLLSVQEIADARAVTANTIKTHLRSIYRKLDVHGRRDAVELARVLGLL